MVQVVVVVVLALVAVAVAALVRRGGVEDPERSASWAAPTQLDRHDFPRPEAPWLVAVFSSATCLACADTWEKARLLESGQVAVVEVEVSKQPEVHDRYRIAAVPLVVVADGDGVVQRSFVGPPTATDLWAAVAELRQPGSVPPGCT